MPEQTKPAAQGRPKSSSVERLALQWLAQRLAERIPEYAAYVGYEGMTVLTDHLRTVAEGFRSGMDAAAVGRHLEELTMVGAPARAAALMAEFPRLRDDAAVLLHGGWVRETALQPPFEGDFARVGIYQGRLDGSQDDALPRVGHAYRHPSLDARGAVMFVATRHDPSSALGAGQLVHWERIEGVERVQRADLPQVELRHRMMLAGMERRQVAAAALPGTIERNFAEAHFREAAPVDRQAFLVQLSGELALALASGEEVAAKSVLNRLAGVSAAAEVVDGPFLRTEDVPGEPWRPEQRP